MLPFDLINDDNMSVAKFCCGNDNADTTFAVKSKDTKWFKMFAEAENAGK